MKQSMQVLTSSKHNDWYTPLHVIEMAREVMGAIHMDPASCATAQAWIEASIYFDECDDGLEQKWFASTLFLNPPYGKTRNVSNQQIWSDKLLEEIRCGHTLEAIMLTKTVPGYKWWDELFQGKWPGPVCITSGRLSFIQADGTTRGKSKAASSLWYYGPNEYIFSAVFSRIGRVIQREQKEYDAITRP